MAKIIKVYQENLPNIWFVGKRYLDSDRINGNFAEKWQEWFQNKWFELLEKLGEVSEIENGYIGLMKDSPHFEYWIGMFLPANIYIPQGFDFVEFAAGKVAICLIKGKEDDGLYRMHEQCLESFKSNGFGNYRKDQKGSTYFFERYNCPRFTSVDKDGNVILDYGVFI